MFKHVSRIILLGLLLSLAPFPSKAQEAAWAKLTPPNTEAFPLISTNLNVYDSEGNFVHDLGLENVNIIENQRTIPIEEITELRNGAQFIVAINMGPAYAIKDNAGTTRYEHVQQALSSWIDTYPPDAVDDLSLVTNDGFEGLHYNRAVAWLSRYRSYEPNFDTAIPSLDVLGNAITTVTDPVSLSDMGRGVLLITPLPNQDSLAALPSLESLARQGNVRVNIWVVSSRAYFDSAGAKLLAEFSRNTGGQIFFYSGDEALPQVDPYVDQLRHTYALSYNSRISTGDANTIAAQITTPALYVTSEAIEFALGVQPPNPIFVAPPLEIIRTEQASAENQSLESVQFAPNKQLIEILIEFPDNYSRSLKRTTLYVDGEIAAENIAEPFDQFSWLLEDFINSGSHLIQVEAEDELGLSGVSIEHMVDIAVQNAPFSVINVIKQNWPFMVGIGGTLAIVALFLALVIAGKIQPRTTGRLIWRRKNQPPKELQTEKVEPAPAEQSIPQETRPTRERLSNWMNRLSWPAKHQDIPEEDAYLEILIKQNGSEQFERIPISQSELTFGADPTLATIEFRDSSLEALHARIIKEENGRFIIFDEGSIAGTWVNYLPVDENGSRLSHGDNIHLGRISLRFCYTNLSKIPKPKVTLQES
ncbi:MAG: FHA domain-containing protein [Anaerolineales bacterium]|nr:FHA domain-containing protein [Chloroflexota bacterium]MBL6980261.1 FHA domain-containing protein [Anaerolineales bacterium]